MDQYVLTPLERRFAVEALIAAQTELKEATDVSQGVVDDLDELLRILGVQVTDGEYEDTRG
jgi:hypothetical protein